MPASIRTSRARFLTRFLAQENASGIVMLLAALLAMVWANSPVAASYQAFIHLPLTFGIGAMATHTIPLEALVKDGLMALFFLVVGMELKREMREGLLSGKGQKLLPLLAALGGMAVPALFYLAFNQRTPEYGHGWAIGSATDIAFAVCVLMLVARQLPPAAKMFLLAVAIFDDLGAILIIALFYSAGLQMMWLAASAFVVGILYLGNRASVAHPLFYLTVGIALLVILQQAGIHGTIAGVVTGAFVPLRGYQGDGHSPLGRMMHLFHAPVAFGVLPLFALTAAGVSLQGIGWESLGHPIVLGITLGLVFGKPIGIAGVTWLALRCGLAALPEGMTGRILLGIACLAGIGFTMSLFIAALAFHEASLETLAKIGVLCGSLLSAGTGAVLLRGCLTTSWNPAPPSLRGAKRRGNPVK